MRTRTRNGRGGGNLVGNGDNGLLYFVTHAILGGNAIDARCLPVERCWTETFLSQMLCRWGMISVARRLDWAFFVVDRILFVKCWFFVKIWRNMSRAASLMLRRRPCGCFIELCAAAVATLALIAATATFVPSRWDPYLPNCCSPLHWSQILERIRLEEPKKCWRSCGVHVGFVMARPRDQHPSVSRSIIASRALGWEKWDFLCFPNFYWIDIKRGRTCFTMDTERILAVIPFHETRAVDETVRTAKMNWCWLF